MPPWHLLKDVLLEALLLPFAVGGILSFASSKILPPRGPVLGGLLAVVAAFFVANNYREVAEYRIEFDRPLSVKHLAGAAYDGVLAIQQAGEKTPSARYWLPWTALLAGIVGVLVRLPRVPTFLSWALRIITTLIVARLLVPQMLRFEIEWLFYAFTAAVLLGWFALEETGKFHPGGILPFCIAAAFLSASVVLLHAQTGLLAELALIAGAAWSGIAVAAWRAGCDGGTGAPLAAVFLPGLMLVGQQTTYSAVPLNSFLLIGLAPLAFVPALLLEALGTKLPRLALLGLALTLAMCGYAVLLAMQAEKVSFN